MLSDLSCTPTGVARKLSVAREGSLHAGGGRNHGLDLGMGRAGYGKIPEAQNVRKLKPALTRSWQDLGAPFESPAFPSTAAPGSRVSPRVGSRVARIGAALGMFRARARGVYGLSGVLEQCSY